MTTQKEAWELAWRQEFPRNAQDADERDDRAMLSASAFKHGYLAAKLESASELRAAKREVLIELWAVVPPRATDGLWKKAVSVLVDKYADPTPAQDSPGPAGSATQAGDTAEAPALDSPAPALPGTSGGLGEFDRLRVRLEAITQAAAGALGFLPHNDPGAKMAADRLAQALADDAEQSTG